MRKKLSGDKMKSEISGTKYSVDENNRLIIEKGGEVLRPEGAFSVDEQNFLVYWLNEPELWRTKYQLPEKITFTGVWNLNANYDLQLQLISQPSKAVNTADTLTIKGEIISCESDKLVFEIKTAQDKGRSVFRLLKLSGNWQANEYNQLSFFVSRKGSPDTLTFKGGWDIGENQQISYAYEKTELKKKIKSSHTLTFSGFWQITSSNRLSYILSSGSNSKFDFKVQIESPDLHPKEGVIKYRLGIGINAPKSGNAKIIALYGEWKFSRKLGLTFQMQYANGEIHSLEFGAEINFDKNNRVVFELTDRNRQRIGLNIIFTHKFLEELDGELFLRLKKYKDETGIETGIRIPF